MRFLADESCDFVVVRALRAAGHDVLAVGEFQRRSVDSQLMEMAYAERRIPLTEDKDFGWLAHVGHMDIPGVILIRFPAIARLTLAGTVTRLVADFGSKLNATFVVLRPGSVRISSIPRTSRISVTLFHNHRAMTLQRAQKMLLTLAADSVAAISIAPALRVEAR